MAMIPRPRVRQLHAWCSDSEHAAARWLCDALDRTMSGVVRLLVVREVRYLRGEYRHCPMCGAALSAHQGAVIARSDHNQ